MTYFLWNTNARGSTVAAQILPFTKPHSPARSTVACFMRMGSTHRKLAELHAAGDFPARRVVVEASRFRHQRELAASLRERGADDLMRRMGEHSHRIERLRASFGHPHETRGDEGPRARPIETRKDTDGSKSVQART